MIDIVKLTTRAGNGGHGRISLHREKYRPKGGPDGGRGGDGGSLIVRGDKSLNTLKKYAGVKEFGAEDGQMGGKNNKTGAKGKDVTLAVPPGTVIWLVAENEISRFRREKFARPDWEELGLEAGDLEVEASGREADDTRFRLKATLQRENFVFEKYYWEKEGQHILARENDDEAMAIDMDRLSKGDRVKELSVDNEKIRALKLAEIKGHGQEIVLNQGGFGGRGNASFKSSINRTPLEAEYGTFGERRVIVFELRLLADVGLVGLPNAGKSTLLSKVTKAHPKVADYPFTTLEPNLGVMTNSDLSKELVVADIPGIIEGASSGKGLGDQFLRHIENCQALMFMLYLPEQVVFDEDLTLEQKAERVWEQYAKLEHELEIHHNSLLQKPRVLTLNKIDIYSSQLIDAIESLFEKKGLTLKVFSAVTGQGLDAVKKEVFELVF